MKKYIVVAALFVITHALVIRAQPSDHTRLRTLQRQQAEDAMYGFAFRCLTSNTGIAAQLIAAACCAKGTPQEHFTNSLVGTVFSAWAAYKATMACLTCCGRRRATA